MNIKKINIGNEATFPSKTSTMEVGEIVGLTDPIHENELDSSLQGKVNQVKTNAGSPTTSTIGYKGQLLIDTTNGNLYQCTNVASNVYTWAQVGGGTHLYRHEVTGEWGDYYNKFDFISTDATPLDDSLVALTKAINIVSLATGYGVLGYYVDGGGTEYKAVFYKTNATDIGMINFDTGAIITENGYAGNDNITQIV